MGSTFRNAYGAWEPARLVWEWTRDFDGAADSHAAHGAHAVRDAVGPSSARRAPLTRRTRGTIPRSSAYGFRSALTAGTTTEGLGFRCARDLRGS